MVCRNFKSTDLPLKVETLRKKKKQPQRRRQRVHWRSFRLWSTACSSAHSVQKTIFDNRAASAVWCIGGRPRSPRLRNALQNRSHRKAVQKDWAATEVAFALANNRAGILRARMRSLRGLVHITICSRLITLYRSFAAWDWAITYFLELEGQILPWIFRDWLYDNKRLKVFQPRLHVQLVAPHVPAQFKIMFNEGSAIMLLEIFQEMNISTSTCPKQPNRKAK